MFIYSGMFLIGVIAGLRAMSAPAAVSWAATKPASGLLKQSAATICRLHSLKTRSPSAALFLSFIV